MSRQTARERFGAASGPSPTPPLLPCLLSLLLIQACGPPEPGSARTPPIELECVPEICNGLDDDCDLVVDEDFDQDGDGFWAEDPGCWQTYGPFAVDCDDSDPLLLAETAEVCNGLDDDCDGAIDEDFDVDGDGFRVDDPGCVDAWGVEAIDCDDTDPTAHPGAEEACDGVDDDCDGAIDEDFDVDGDGSWASDPGCIDAWGSGAIDCDDLDPTVNTVDEDGDGWTSCGGDCDDDHFYVHPGRPELCNGVDDDCDPSTDEATIDADGDGSAMCEDCDEDDPGTHPGAVEQCDAADHDCDGLPATWEQCPGECGEPLAGASAWLVGEPLAELIAGCTFEIDCWNDTDNCMAWRCGELSVVASPQFDCLGSITRWFDADCQLVTIDAWGDDESSFCFGTSGTWWYGPEQDCEGGLEPWVEPDCLAGR